MRELKVANAALGNKQALDALWQEHGYWFFREVLDKQALRVMRSEYMRELTALDLIEPATTEPIWNGKALDKFPTKFATLHERRIWQNFVRDPKINAFFEYILGDAVYWIPVDYYRLVPPTKTPVEDPYGGRHQDGFGIPGVEFMTCWIPLADTDADVGGLAIAEEHHTRGYFKADIADPSKRDMPIPADSWSRADYRPGDVVIFAPTMPHSGLPNKSDRFRLSVDIRVMRRSSRLPIVGEVRSITPEQVVIRNEDDTDVALTLDDTTQLRGWVPNYYQPMPVVRSDVSKAIPPGSLVMATQDNGRAILVRPQS